MTFLMDRWDGRSSSSTDNSWEITLAELLNWGSIDNYGMASNYSIPMAIKKNMRSYGLQAAGTVIGLKVGEKVLQKAGVFRNVNKIVRSAGLGKLVKV